MHAEEWWTLHKKSQVFKGLHTIVIPRIGRYYSCLTPTSLTGMGYYISCCELGRFVYKQLERTTMRCWIMSLHIGCIINFWSRCLLIMKCNFRIYYSKFTFYSFRQILAWTFSILYIHFLCFLNTFVILQNV